MFATGDDRCPVEAYKVYASKRPSGMNDADSPFYVACRTVPLRDSYHDKWFINQRVGKKKISKMMKQMQIAGSLNPAKRLTNHSARKHLVQKLRDSNVPPTDIMQISGHKSIQSVLTYSNMSEKQHRNCSDILSTTKSATATKYEDKENSFPSVDTSKPLPCDRLPVIESLPSSQSLSSSTHVACPTHFSNAGALSGATSAVPQHLQSLFGGATLHIGNLNLYLNGQN